jgi:RNA polymerase sigma-70 factor, ECF subfamily
MDSTSVSLLQRLRQPDQESAWQRFVDLYAPLIFRWGQTQGLNGTDALDLVQEVMATLVVKLPEFEYDPKQRFRGWLKTVTVNTARNMLRRESSRPTTSIDQTIDSVAVADSADLFEESEYCSFLAKQALRLMQTEFQERTWKACWKHVADGRTAADVGQELNISANAVHIAKCRVMRRLREELNGLLE